MIAVFRSAAALLLALCTVHAADEVWVDLFNGKDLSNWVNVNCAPETWKVEDGVIKCTGIPTGGLRTPRMYENFIMEVEWRHMKSGGNAGVFIWASPIAAKGVPFLRAIEVQVLDEGYGNTETHTTHGDVFPIHGSSMIPLGRHNGQRSFPSENRSKPTPEWNHYRIECHDGILRLSVNGKEVSGGDKCNYRKGYLGLESEGSPTEWRLVRIQELPPSNAPAAETADEAQGHRPLYNGLDLRGWKTETPDAWKPSDWMLSGKSSPDAKPIWSERDGRDFELIFDFKLPPKAKGKATILLRDESGKAEPVNFELAGALSTDPRLEAGKWHRARLTVKGRSLYYEVDGKPLMTPDLGGPTLPGGLEKVRGIGLSPVEGGIDFGNLYVRDL